MSNQMHPPEGAMQETPAAPSPPAVQPEQRQPVGADQAETESVASEQVYDLVEVPPAQQKNMTPVDAEPAAAAAVPVVAASAADADAETGRSFAEDQPRSATSAASMQTIYLPSPVPPRRKGNRGFGVLVALLSSVVFAGLYAIAIAIIHAIEIGVVRFDFFGSLAFYTPVIFFFVGFVVVVVVVNRAAWWAYVVGSIFVALIAYSGSVATSLLVNNVIALTPAQAGELFFASLSSPFIIAAALLAREVSMWMGAIISARGRKVKARNLEARATFDRESAERTTEYENSRYRAHDGIA